LALDSVNTNIIFDPAKIGAMQTGDGPLMDANDARELATLQALQVQQQLSAASSSTSSTSIAQQIPSLFDKLFR
jgi:hypothetical protein